MHRYCVGSIIHNLNIKYRIYQVYKFKYLSMVYDILNSYITQIKFNLISLMSEINRSKRSLLTNCSSMNIE